MLGARMMMAAAGRTEPDGGEFSPTDIADLSAWLKADALTGLSDGDPVTNWPDESGNGNNATQATSGIAPVYKESIVNGLPIVRGNGVDTEMDFSGPIVSGSGNRTVFIVAKHSGAGPSDSLLTLGFDDTSTTGVCFQMSPEIAVRVRGGNRVFDTAAPTASFGIVAVELDGSTTQDLSAWLNGTALGVSSTANATLATAGNSTMFYKNAGGGGNEYGAGDMGEIIVYGRALTTGERNDVTGYLAEKWGVTI